MQGAAVFLVAATLIVAAQVPPVSSWGGSSYVVTAAVALIVIELVVRAARRRDVLLASLAGYNAVVVIGHVFQQVIGVPRAALIGVAGASVVLATLTLGFAARRGMRQVELDRLIFSEASSVAFFATMFAVITFGLLESWLSIEPPSPWTFAIVGAVAWVAMTIGLRRKYD